MARAQVTSRRKRERNPIEEFEDQVREQIETAVETFGFAGVLEILADEAAERAAADDDDSTEKILDAIESAIEEVTACEECEEEDEEEESDEEE